MKRLILSVMIAGFVCLVAETAFGDIINVPTTEYPTIQVGINAATAGDTVQVAAGTYYENTTMKSGVVIRGTGAGDDPSIHSIIDGGANDSVVSAESVDSAARLEGFKISNGEADSGGGMYNSNSSPAVSDCSFSDNSAILFPTVGSGGGMYNISSSPTVINCNFSENDSAGSGGGMQNDLSSPTVTNCTFSGNTAYTHGGGMYNAASSPTVTNSNFSENDSSSGSGGGMANFQGSSPTVNGCSFVQNLAHINRGGGMYNESDSSPTLVSVRP